MEVLWSLGVGTVAAVHAGFPRARRVAYNTVLTQVRLLHRKGYLAREPVGRAHVYRPRIDRDETLRRVVRQVADQYFGGSLDEMARFVGRAGSAGGSAREGAEAP